MPRISVIIPTFNCASFITRAIRSVMTQTFTDYEIIVVDDGSIDSTRDIVCSSFSSVRYFYQSNQGPAAARNLGINYAKGNFICFLDADDEWIQDKLELQFKLWEQKNHVSFIYCGAIFVDENHNLLGVRDCVKLSRQKVLNALRIGNCFSTPTTFIKKDCFQKLGGFDTSLMIAEDWDMWMRICFNFDFDAINKRLVRIYVRNCSQSFFAEKNLKNEISFIKKVTEEKMYEYSFLLTCKAYAYRFFAAAIAFRENCNPGASANMLMKAWFTYPLIIFKVKYIRFLLQVIFIDKLKLVIKHK